LITSFGSPYEFSFISNPKILTFDDSTFKLFPKIELRSDLFKFYAYGEVIFVDNYGIVTDSINFVEGLPFDFKLGCKDDGYLETTMVWAENQLLDTNVQATLSGNNTFMFLSRERMYDKPISKMWKNYKISDIVQEIATSQFKLSADKIYITPTIGSNDFMQLNETNREFLLRLANLAVDQNNQKSPFFTFINTIGEFYFQSVTEFFNQQPIGTYEFTFNKETSLDPFAMKKFTLLLGGVPVNYKNYKKKAYSIDKSGAYVTSDEDIKDYYTKLKNEKLLIRSSYQQVTDVVDLGLIGTDDKQIRQGKLNAMYKNSALSYRMPMVIQFNPKAVAGYCIDLKVYSNLPNKEVSTEWSGKWLIVRDHILVNENGKISTKLTLAKSGIQVDSKHPIKDFVSK
jgi:hypothetical protein